MSSTGEASVAIVASHRRQKCVGLLVLDLIANPAIFRAGAAFAP
jgi:hypothetical protein